VLSPIFIVLQFYIVISSYILQYFMLFLCILNNKFRTVATLH